jgi:hypothetical protein
MNPLQKFVEQDARGEKRGRIAYAFGLSKLPAPNTGMEWRLDAAFNAAEEVLRDSSLGDVFKVAIADGCAIVSR